MINETKLKILGSFFPEGKEITLKKLMERTSLSYEPVYRNIKELEKDKLITQNIYGKTKIYSLVAEKEEVKLAFFFYAKSRIKVFSKKYEKIYSALTSLKDEDTEFLAVFGSYAKGNTTKESDVDVICVSSDKKENEREIGGLKYLTNLDFAPLVMPKSEFRKIRSENDVFWKDLIKYGIIFKGYELFYTEVYHNEKYS